MQISGSHLLSPPPIDMLDNPSRNTWMVLGGVGLAAAVGGLYWYMSSSEEEEVVAVDPAKAETTASEPVTGTVSIGGGEKTVTMAVDPNAVSRLGTGPRFAALNRSHR